MAHTICYIAHLAATLLSSTLLTAACGSGGAASATDSGGATDSGSGGESRSSGETPTGSDTTTVGLTATSEASGGVSMSGASSGEGSTGSVQGTGGSTGDDSSTTSGSSTTGGSSSDGTGSTGVIDEPGVPVELGTAGNYVILGKSGISTVPKSAVTGDIGVSPAAATAITGFSLILDPTNVFSLSTQVTGKVYAADYKAPTPTKLTKAIGDMQLAYTEAAARPPDVTELGAGDIGGMVLEAGVYNWSSPLLIAADLKLDGSATDVWVFQIAQSLTVTNAAEVALVGGAVAKNVFWQVAGPVDLGKDVHFEGIVLTQTSVAMKPGASLNGRLLAQTAVTLITNVVTQPAP